MKFILPAFAFGRLFVFIGSTAHTRDSRWRGAGGTGPSLSLCLLVEAFSAAEQGGVFCLHCVAG